VPDFRLVARPALADHQLRELPAHPAITIALVTDYALATVMMRRNQAEQLTRRVRETYGLELPWLPRRATAGATAFAWAGPGHWLASTTQVDGPEFTATVRATLDGVASVSDQSDSRAVFRVSGSGARAALAKGLPIDLHPRAFAPGDTAVTLAAHIPVHIWQIAALPTYELATPRTLAASFLDWLGWAAAAPEQ
jgi:methylglutamate dehydrogenase subunit D